MRSGIDWSYIGGFGDIFTKLEVQVGDTRFGNSLGFVISVKINL